MSACDGDNCRRRLLLNPAPIDELPIGTLKRVLVKDLRFVRPIVEADAPAAAPTVGVAVAFGAFDNNKERGAIVTATAEAAKAETDHSPSDSKGRSSNAAEFLCMLLDGRWLELVNQLDRQVTTHWLYALVDSTAEGGAQAVAESDGKSERDAIIHCLKQLRRIGAESVDSRALLNVFIGGAAAAPAKRQGAGDQKKSGESTPNGIAESPTTATAAMPRSP